MTTQSYILVFDGTCSFCSKYINLLIKLQRVRIKEDGSRGRIYVVSGKKLDNNEYCQEIIRRGFHIQPGDLKRMSESTIILLSSNKRRYIRSCAILKILYIIRPNYITYLGAKISEVRIARAILDCIYIIVAMNRQRISKIVKYFSSTECMVASTNGIFTIL